MASLHAKNSHPLWNMKYRYDLPKDVQNYRYDPPKEVRTDTFRAKKYRYEPPKDVPIRSAQRCTDTIRPKEVVCKHWIGNLKYENSQDYAQKPQRNCTFTNSASVQCVCMRPETQHGRWKRTEECGFACVALYTIAIDQGLQLFTHCPTPTVSHQAVEGLYCKRPIQCLASSEMLTPHPLTARRVCVYPPPLVRGVDTLAGWRGGWGVNSSEDARHCSVLYICKYFVYQAI